MTKTSGNPRSAASLRAALIVVLVASIATGTGCSGGQNAPVSPVTPSDARGAEVAFDHAGLTTDCASCHGTNQPFAAFPVAVHRPTGGLDCSRCHAASSATGGGAWGKGRFHVSGSAAPATCLECHAAAAPASTAGWLGTSYATSPFDYGINSLGVPHGGGQDCGVCHAGPGTGAWGNQPSWVSGHFEHGPFSLAEQTCIACHVSQRPDLQPGATAETMAARLGFDHAPLATMDCIGCHWATVASGTYVNYSNPATSTLPGGDWQGGQSYPGARPVGFPGEHLELETTTLTLSAAKDRVLSAAVGWEDLRDLMIHTSAAVPPEVRPGLAGAPDYGRCWHCHANQHGLVTMYPRGHFHGELARYAVTPDAPVTPLPQPTRGCKECHAATLPTGIVARSSLQPMNHGIAFASTALVGEGVATGVNDLDCSTCHHEPNGQFIGAVFHANTAAVPLQDCVSCHYVTMVDPPTADVRSGTAYQMRHTSAQMPFHTCQPCHASALARATTSTTLASDSWRPGQYHAVLSVQPTRCNDCHASSAPATHGSIAALGDARDCSDCHLFPGTGTRTAPDWLGATTPL